MRSRILELEEKRESKLIGIMVASHDNDVLMCEFRELWRLRANNPKAFLARLVCEGNSAVECFRVADSTSAESLSFTDHVATVPRTCYQRATTIRVATQTQGSFNKFYLYYERDVEASSHTDLVEKCDAFFENDRCPKAEILDTSIAAIEDQGLGWVGVHVYIVI